MHGPYASLSPVTARHTLTATSASKAWNLPGLKAAQLVLSDAADAEHWARVGFLYGHGASTLGVLAATAAYDTGGPWLDGVLAYLDGNRRLLADLLAERLPEVAVPAARGHLPGVAGLPAARPGRVGGRVLPRARRGSRSSTGRSAATRGRATCG